LRELRENRAEVYYRGGESGPSIDAHLKSLGFCLKP
jgi:hypothetical protein